MRKTTLVLADPNEKINRMHIYRDDSLEVLAYVNDATSSLGVWTAIKAGTADWREFLTKEAALNCAMETSVRSAMATGVDLLFWDEAIFPRVRLDWAHA